MSFSLHAFTVETRHGLINYPKIERGYLPSPKIVLYFRIEGEAGMGKLHTIGKTIITVYANDHLPPHFHIVHPDFEALIEIETFATYAGELKGAGGKDATKWAAENVQKIKAEWNRVNPRWPIACSREMRKNGYGTSAH